MGLLLGGKDVNEFVDKVVEEALEKEEKEKNESKERAKLK